MLDKFTTKLVTLFNLYGNSVASGNTVTAYEESMIYAGSIHVIVNNGSAYMPEVDIKIYKNGTQLKSYSWSTKATDDFYIDVVEGDVIKITLGNTTGQGRTLYARITGTIDGYMPGKKAKIFELKPIGKKATAILLGRLPTGERRDGN